MSNEADTYEEPDQVLLLYSGLEDAFLGSAESYGRPPVACYSKRMTIKILQDNYGLSKEDADKRYEYEYLQTSFEDATPIFLDDEPLKNVPQS